VSAFRRKPGLVEAVQWDGAAATAGAFLGREGTDWRYRDGDASAILIPHGTSWMEATLGDWLVKAGGRVWVVEARAFAALYEPVDAAAEGRAAEVARDCRRRFESATGRGKRTGGATPL
jgi:hypothetical protein